MSARRARPRAPKVPGVSYRQLDWWAKNNLLHPQLENPRRGGGTGNFRIWPAEELRVAEDMGRLRAVKVDLYTAHALARQGREAVNDFLSRLPRTGATS